MQIETSVGLSRRLEEVSQAMRRQISAGAWIAGQQVPPERELAQHYGLARNSLRRVLRRLEDEGLLERHVGRGTFVRPAKAPPAPLTSSPRQEVAVRLKGASPADLMEVRLLVEPQVVALAASRASAGDLQGIELALKQSIAAKGLAEFEHWDAQLHLGIFRAAKNGILSAWCEAINQVRNEPDWYRLKKRSLTPELRLTYDREHSAIVTALKERDPESARRAMSQHLTRVRDSLLAIG
jgi:DNA-binding FadR family transcriptional regulator